MKYVMWHFFWQQEMKYAPVAPATEWERWKTSTKVSPMKRARVSNVRLHMNVFIKLDARNQFPRLWGASINFPFDGINSQLCHAGLQKRLY
jgi:hypothetical protein